MNHQLLLSPVLSRRAGGHMRPRDQDGGAAWGKFPERKGYLSSVLKEVTESAWCRPGAMGHPRG